MSSFADQDQLQKLESTIYCAISTINDNNQKYETLLKEHEKLKQLYKTLFTKHTELEQLYQELQNKFDEEISSRLFKDNSNVVILEDVEEFKLILESRLDDIYKYNKFSLDILLNPTKIDLKHLFTREDIPIEIFAHIVEHSYSTANILVKYACKHDNIAIIDYIISCGPPKEHLLRLSIRKGLSSIHYACGYLSINIIKRLIDWGIQLDVVDDLKCFPLHYACGIYTFYAENDPRSKNDNHDSNSQDSDNQEEENNNQEESEEESNRKKIENQTIIIKHILDKCQVGINSPNEYGDTPLSLLCNDIQLNDSSLELLLKAGASPAIPVIRYGQTPIHTLAYYSDTFSSTVELSLLLKYCPDIELCIDALDSNGNTALGLAVKCKNTDYIKLLLEAGASPFVKKDNDSDNLIHTICKKKDKKSNVSILFLLLNYTTHKSSDHIDDLNAEGLSALHQTILDEKLEFVKMLLNMKASIECSSSEGKTAIQYAFHKKNIDIIRELLKN